MNGAHWTWFMAFRSPFQTYDCPEKSWYMHDIRMHTIPLKWSHKIHYQIEIVFYKQFSFSSGTTIWLASLITYHFLYLCILLDYQGKHHRTYGMKSLKPISQYTRSWESLDLGDEFQNQVKVWEERKIRKFLYINWLSATHITFQL